MARPILTFRTVETNLGSALLVTFEVPGGITSPAEFDEVCEEAKGQFVPTEGAGLVVDGRGPVWGYGMILHEGHPSSWAATRDPRLGMVVVSTHSPHVKRGTVVEFPVAA